MIRGPLEMTVTDVEEMNVNSQEPLTLIETLAIVGNLLLALKHPRNKGATSIVVRKVGRRLATELVRRVPDLIPREVKREWKKADFIK